MRNRNYEVGELHDIFQRLIEEGGAENLLGEMEAVMSTANLADVLTDICDNWDLDYMEGKDNE